MKSRVKIEHLNSFFGTYSFFISDSNVGDAGSDFENFSVSFAAVGLGSVERKEAVRIGAAARLDWNHWHVSMIAVGVSVSLMSAVHCLWSKREGKLGVALADGAFDGADFVF